MGRWVAKNVVAAGLAEQVRGPVRLRHRPPAARSASTSTPSAPAHVDEAKILEAVQRGLLLQAGRHRQAAQPAPPDLPQDHQLRPLRQEDDTDLTWEETDKAADLKNAAGA